MRRPNRLIIFLALAAISASFIFTAHVRLTQNQTDNGAHQEDASFLPAEDAILRTKARLGQGSDGHLGSTGKVFSGDKIREFRGSCHLNPSSASNKIRSLFPNFDTNSCEQWAVVTTIFSPQEAFHKVVGLSAKWCLVIVGDEITPDDEYEQFADDHDDVFYLSASYQKKHLGSNEFMSKMPYKSFARKNIGYLFAIHHGAKVLFDFDDDNILTPVLLNTDLAPPFFWMDQVSRDDVDEWSESSMLLQFLDAGNMSKDPRLSFNPFKYMNSSVAKSWPRGFPLDDLQEDFEAEPRKVLVGDLPYKSIGVIQALCDGNPDTDAIFRLTRHKATDFTFRRTASSLPLMVPFSHYTPYNAQATTHLYNSFWGLYLPISVPGRVTDIWRSYIVQRLMKDVGLYLVYSQPIVQHKRSPHDYLADFTAEMDLYHKTAKLINHLDRWSSMKANFSDRVMDLWVELFEHDYLGMEDVIAVREWLNVLISIGYEFPALVDEGSIQGPRPQPDLDGQPFRAFPFYHQSSQLSIVPENSRPNNKAVVKIIMMTMNEWPLVKSWVLYHGDLYGFHNLYIIDSSTYPDAIAFLIYARDILGVNVLFSDANLNGLEKIMTRIGLMISGSSDYIIKMDTDEYLAVYDEESKTLKSSLAKQYLGELMANVSKPVDPKMCTRFLQWTSPSKDLCDNDANAAPYLFSLKEIEVLPWFKAVLDSRYIDKYRVNLGGHAHSFLGFDDDCVNQGSFSIIHAHSRCYEIEQENNKRVLIRHNYIKETDSRDAVIEKLKKLIKCDWIDQCTCVRLDCRRSSCHKIDPYLNHLLCPERTKESYYNVTHLTLSRNENFAITMQSAMTRFGL